MFSQTLKFYEFNILMYLHSAFYDQLMNLRAQTFRVFAILSKAFIIQVRANRQPTAPISCT
jgi:hypothetical protein